MLHLNAGVERYLCGMGESEKFKFNTAARKQATGSGFRNRRLRFGFGFMLVLLVECPANTAVSVVEATTTAGAGSLSYDVPSGTYNYVWKTESSWTGTCRTFDMILDDGSSHQAMFRFVR